MSDSSKPQRPGATPIKNPLLSASVTGLTFDDFPNKPFLLPAAPPIVHAPPPAPPTATVTPTALLGREHKSLVTLGSSSLDTENLDEINLNASNEDSVTSGTCDPNANPLLEQPPTTDSILSQAASSFSALPSVASNVFSSFSKRITAISSRETTPIYDQSSSDVNANYTVPQLDIQPTYTQQHLPVAPEPFYAPQPAPPQGGSYFGSFPPPSAGKEDIQNTKPPLEPPKFYVPGEVAALPIATAVPPPSAGGQNNFRLSAKKKLYAPIPGLSDQSQQPAPTFDPTAVSAPISYDQFGTTSYPPHSYPHEERKPAGGLFSKITNLAPSGVLQNITGLVQSATGTITQTIKPDSSHSGDPQHYQTGITFDQQPSNYFAGPPLTAAAPLVGQEAYPNPATFAPNQAPAPAVPFFNPHSSDNLSLPAGISPAAVLPAPQPTEVNFFDPSKAAAVFDPSKQIINPFETARPPSQPSSFFQDPYQQSPVAPPPSAASSQPSRPPSHPSRPPSQPGITVFAQQQTPIPFFNPSQAATDVLQVPSLATPVPNTLPSQVGVLDPTKYLPTNPTPVQALVPPPPVASALPPPPGGQTSFRLQKGTRLYKNPLTVEETAPVHVVPNQIAANPTFPHSQPAFAPPTFAHQQSFAPPPLASDRNVGQVPLVPPQGVYDLYAPKQFHQTVVPSTITQVPNIFVPSAEPQSCSLFAPTTAEAHKSEDNNKCESIPLLTSLTGEEKLGSEQRVPLFSAPVEETGNQSVSLVSAPTAEVKAEEPKAEEFIGQTKHQAEPRPEKPEKEQLAEVYNSAYFFQPIDPVVESISNQQETTGSPVNFFGTNEEYQLLKPIEPIVEEQKVIAELQSNQTNAVDSFEQALQKVFLTAEVQSAPSKCEVIAPPSAANASLESVPNLPTVAVSVPLASLPATLTSDTLSTIEPKVSSLVLPPSAQPSLGTTNPYRRGSATETAKPPAVQHILANFFTPGPGNTSTGDFNFFSTLPSAQESSVQQTETDFFSTQTSQQSGDIKNFFSTPLVDNIVPEAFNHIQTQNFFAATEPKLKTSPVVVAESSSPQAAAINSQNIITSAACGNKAEAVGVEPQQSTSSVNTTPYPPNISTQQGAITVSFPPLPKNIGIIPSVQENTENINKHQGEINLQYHAPPPPIGFENFVQPQNQVHLDPVPKPPTAAESVQQQASTTAQSQDQGEINLQSREPLPPLAFENFAQTQNQVKLDPVPKPPTEAESVQLQALQASDTNPVAPENTTQHVISTAATKQQLPVVNSFSNYFNLNSTTKPEITKDPSAFFDSFAGQSQQRQASSDLVASTQVAASNEDQVIQNFFNNPPPKDAYHAGDLNYDLIHSGLAIRNLQQRSLTPVSNLVEPPSSACSEFSNLTIDASTTDTSIIKEDTKVEHSSASAADTSIKHCEELPEEILKELRMANLLQGDKVATTPPASVSYKPVVKHWFYKRTVDGKQIWTPFSHYDSALLETSLTMEGDDKPNIVAVEGGRYDVNISERLKRSIYWDSEPIEIRRCSWFYKAIDSKYIPYEESTADILEADYKHAAESGSWHKTIILSMGEQVVFHGPTVIVHYQHQHNQDAWGGTTQTTTRPRVVKRDLDDFRIEQGESQKVDHLLFMVHGIGSACDLKLRSVEEVVHDFRSIAHQLVQSHYKNSTDLGLVGRVEVLPISWHNHLHSLEEGIDDKLRSITLESIPKLRNFTNDTLLDILFYTSPTFAQKIMNSIVMSLNDIYLKYRQRHPEFNGGVSLAGHSLGSLILFDLLCHQKPIKECEEKNLENPDQQFMTTATNSAISSPTAAGRMHLDSNQMESKQISYTMGPAGTGQPGISYGQLIFQPKKFFALGSPIGMFVTIRGIDKLGLDFRLPTCTGFYNIFHPYDPVAYRIEALVNPDLSGARPVLIPHHKGRKRMHLELKETMARVSTDLKNKFLDKFKNTFESVNIFGTTTKTKKEAEELMEKEVEKVIKMQMQLEHQDQPQPSKSHQSQELISPSDEHLITPTPSQTLRSRTDSVSTVVSDDMVEIDLPLGKLNDSKRIDYVLQEAPLEFINEYIFALSSHVCYWDSEDTILFVMKEIYSGLGISPDSQVPQQTMTIERPSSRNSLSHS